MGRRKKEVWKSVVGNDMYLVSNYGSVKSVNSGEPLKQYPTGKGYVQVFPYYNGKRKHKLVHILVAEAFITNPKPEEYNQVNHKNCIKTDNYVGNLEWCDNRYNTLYYYRHRKKM